MKPGIAAPGFFFYAFLKKEIYHMNAQELINRLQLLPHPEGGFYKEIYRSESGCSYEGHHRSVLTGIYFLLRLNEHSRWHVVDADEVWHYYDGAPLELFIASPDLAVYKKIILGPVTEGYEATYVIPRNWYQAARSAGDWSLSGCNVAPGFSFDGFRFLTSEEAELFPMISAEAGSMV
jgi:predicted cupin superfamily sugar epimerase